MKKLVVLPYIYIEYIFHATWHPILQVVSLNNNRMFLKNQPQFQSYNESLIW